MEPIGALDDHVVIVTGASGGVGGGVVQRALAAGARVVRHANRGRLPDPVEGRTCDAPADLTGPVGPETVLEAALETFGRIDGLVHAAGIQPVVALSAMHEEQWREVIEVDLTTAHRVAKAVADHMAAASGGAIVHVASIEGHQPSPGHAHYAAAKAGLLMHARAMALEYGPHGVRVNTVSPGLIDRPGLAEEWPDGHQRWLQAAPLGRLGRPEDVGDACVFLLSPQAEWITGADLVVDGGVSARPTW